MPVNTINRQRDFRSQQSSAVALTRGKQASSFDAIIRSAHWLTLICIVVVLSTAFLIDQVPPHRSATVLQLHRSFGLAVWGITVLRLIWRQFAHFPAWPQGMTPTMRRAAYATECLLYGLLLLQPILGFLHSNAHGGKVTFFSLFRIPSLIGHDDERAETLIAAHAIVAKVLMAVIAVHALAALFHHFVLKDETLSRMLRSGARK